MLVVLAVVVGVIGGLGAVAFRQMIQVTTAAFDAMVRAGDRAAASVVSSSGAGFALSTYLHDGAAMLLRVLSPALGLLIVGLIVRYFAPEVKGHGVPQVLEALALRSGRLRPRTAAWGIVTPSITIGGGGSVGQEGPIALIGAAFGSALGQLLRVPDKFVALLLACGAAAGIAATFNAPIAGAFFALEVILGSYAMGTVVPALVAAVVGSATFSLVMGSRPVLPAPAFTLGHPGELVLMLLLGLLGGAAGLAYTRGLAWIEERAERWKASFASKALAGGLLVGLIGLAFPQVLRVGYDTMERAVRGELAWGIMGALFLTKYVATLATIGAGGSGGVFAPSLYLGIMLGGLYGGVVHQWMPAVATAASPYALVGMGAIFAAAAQAPLTAITIVLEMTGDYGLTLGVMAACAVSYLVHGSLSRDSMYTVRLSRRGITIVRGNEVRPSERILVSAAMAPPGQTISGRASVEEAYRRLVENGHEPLVVVDNTGRLEGVLSLTDLRNRLPPSGPLDRAAPVATVANRNVVTVFPDDTLDRAMRRFGVYDFAMLPVVARDDPRRVVGRLRRGDVLKAYTTFTMHNLEASVRIDFLRETYRDEGAFREVVVPAASRLAGHLLKDVQLPEDCVVVLVRRQGDVLVPHGNTLLRTGDRLLLFAAPASRADDIARELADGRAGGRALQVPAG